MNISDFFVEKHKSEQKWKAYAKCGVPNLATNLSEVRKKGQFWE